MELVNEEYDSAIGLLDFVENCLESLFELTPKLASCDERTEVERDDTLVA